MQKFQDKDMFLNSNFFKLKFLPQVNTINTFGNLHTL